MKSAFPSLLFPKSLTTFSPPLRIKITIKPLSESPQSRAQTLCNRCYCSESMESPKVPPSDHAYRYTGTFEILTETVRILKQNPIAFITIGALMISPVSAICLSNILIDQSIVKTLTVQLLLIAKSSGLPLNPFVKQFCNKLSEIAISTIIYFPLFITLLLISKAAVVYSIECSYCRKKFDPSKFSLIIRTIWRRIISTYLLNCAVIFGCMTVFIMLLICVSKLCYVIGLSPDSIAYIAIVIALFFSVFLAHTFIMCDLSMVISVLEDVSGPQALFRSSVLIKGQTKVGLIIFLGSTIAMTIVKGLFEHRVKSLSYRDGSSRIWERPVLVVMHSFMVLVDFMMSSVFCFSCSSYSLEGSSVECRPVLENVSISLASSDNK